MERTLLGSTASNLNGNLGSAWNSFRGKASPQPIRTMIGQAYGAWSLKDLFKTGKNVVQLYDASASPTARDFTATELTDGTYTSWVSGTAYVAKLYDQLGSNDLANTSNGLTTPIYDASDNTVKTDKGGIYGTYRGMSGSSTDAIENNFGGNNIGDGVTFFANVRSNTGTNQVGNQPYWGVIDNAPASAEFQRSKALHLNASNGIGGRVKDQGYTEFVTTYDNALTSSLQNYTVTIFRNPTIADTVTFELYRAGVKEKTTNTDTLDNGTLRVRSFNFGNGRGNANILLAYNRRLSELEVAKLEREIKAV